MKNRIEIKAEAKSIVARAKVSPLLISAIVILINWILNNITPANTYFDIFWDEMDLAMAQGEQYVSSQLPVPTLPETFFMILAPLIITVLSAGYYSYCMGIRHGREMTASSLLDGLGIAGKVIWCDILISIRVFLWSCLLVVPGIIAIYRYRFAVYNLISNPSLSASQAISLSSRQTHGMKWDLFVLDLSFLGWNILAALTLGILNIWVLPYTTLSDLGYYENAQMRMREDASPSADPFA